jgi:DMSO/TMAO reductase YedYZ molybdopterin-dependent catalytic subunit
MEAAHPVLNPAQRHHLGEGEFEREQVRLANRNSGLLLEALRHDVTPLGLHYLLTHFDVPYVPSSLDWRLEILGQVPRPLVLSVDDLRKRPQHTVTVTLECAGNGRSLLKV